MKANAVSGVTIASIIRAVEKADRKTLQGEENVRYETTSPQPPEERREDPFHAHAPGLYERQHGAVST